MSERADALRQALEAVSDNHPLRLMLAETLHAEGQTAAAVEEYGQLLRDGKLPRESLITLGRLALDAGEFNTVAACVGAARHLGVVEGVSALEQELAARQAEQDQVRRVQHGPDYAATPLPVPQVAETTFADVGGLEALKKTIHRTIILPYQRPDLYATYGRRVGGGVMLYGPPGCGKTLLARATAGECGLPFVNIRIEDILDPWLGLSERNLHAAFERARADAPCVIFIDELDGLAYARRKQHNSASRALVDQLLQELDAIGADNQHLLILGATNAPWDVDDALKRPGRFDRVIFVPPPDEAARAHVLQVLLSDRPTVSLDLPRLAKATPLWSGADLRALVERAIDLAIEQALETGHAQPLRMAGFETALVKMRPSTLDWLASARNYVEFANQGGQYDELATFLRTREVKAAKV